MALDPSIYVDAAWAGLSPEARSLLDESRFRRAEGASLRAYYRELGPGGGALDGYARSVPFEGASPEEYAHRGIDLGGGCHILGGLHVYGLDPRRPFVNIRGTSRPLTPRELQEAADTLMGLYPKMAPRTLRYWGGMVTEAIPGPVVDQRLLVGSLDHLQTLEPVPGFTLRPDPDGRAYAPLKSSFDAFAESMGAARPFLRFVSRGDLRDASESGAVRVAYLGETLVGLIAATRGEELGVEGWVMLEEFISPAYQGRGLGKAMQGAFLKVLRDQPGSGIVLGTIDGRNLPSLKTAQACGRHVAGEWLFSPKRP